MAKPADERSDQDGSPPAGAQKGGFKPTDLVALLVASLAIGIAVSAIMTDVGTSPWVVMGAAALAYSGTGELAYASVISSGGTMAPALAAALLVSSRFGLLAMSMANRWPASRLERVGMAHVASEPAVAAAIEAGDTIGPRAARRAYWQIATWLAVGWVIGSGLGLLLGDVLGDTEARRPRRGLPRLLRRRGRVVAPPPRHGGRGDRRRGRGGGPDPGPAGRQRRC